MLRHAWAALTCLVLAACDTASSPSPEAKTLQDCFAQRGLTVEKYMILAIAEKSYTLCSDKIRRAGDLDERGLRLGAALAPFVLDERPECGKARRALIEPAYLRTMEAYRKDGGEAFCGWVRRMHDEQNPDLIYRFWK